VGGVIVSHVVELATTGRLDKVSDKAKIVVMVMASIGRDRDQPNVQAGVYYGGWPLLARALGYPLYTPAAHRAVARAIAELIDAGLIEPLGDPRPGVRQAYRITLPPTLDD
jgi:hypothetical protein